MTDSTECNAGEHDLIEYITGNEIVCNKCDKTWGEAE